MFRAVIVLVIALLPVAGNLLAGEEDAGPVEARDVLGIYFDGQGSLDCVSLPAGEHDLYLMLAEPSVQSGLAGWECALDIQSAGSCVVLDWGLQGGGVNIATPPQFKVVLPEPLPAEARILLLDLTILLLDEGPVRFFVRPAENPGLAGAPGYVTAGAVSRLVPLTPASGDPDLPVATINDDCREEAPWRSLKGRHD